VVAAKSAGWTAFGNSSTKRATVGKGWIGLTSYVTRFLAGLLIAVSVFSVPAALADNRSEPGALGYWETADHQGVVQIYTCGVDTLCGALVGMEFDHPTDPMPMTWNHRPQCDFPFIGNLKQRSNGAWFGSITNPKSGKTYNARIELASPGVLKLRGYLFVPALGQTETWTRFPGVPPAGCRMAASDF
jgi:uncharacterized protein (DUF2147 family)